MTPFVVGTIVCVSALLQAEHKGQPLLKAILKPLASLGFCGAALSAGAAGSDFGRWLLAALALSLVGDVALLSREKRAFLTGLSAFLAAHVLFGVAFWVRGVEPLWTLVAAAPLFGIAVVVQRWLWPHVKRGMRGPVLAYIAAIVAMVALAAGAFGAGASPVVPLGAVMFFVSDLAVARDRFVAPGFANRLWGLPLYYAAQLLLASSVTG